MGNRTNNLPFFSVFWSLVFLAMISCTSQSGDPFAESFKNPPLEAKPQVWWHWIYGNVTRDGITRDLEQMSALGIGGVTLFHNAFLEDSPKRPRSPRGPVRFMSKEYRDLVKFSLEECRRLDMTMGLQICDGFSQTGGPWITPEQGMRILECQIAGVPVGKSFQCQTPQNTVRVLAYPGNSNSLSVDMIKRGNWHILQSNSKPILDPASCIDLTDIVQADGTFEWDAPDGEWLILMFFHSLHPATNHPASPEGHGLECNKLNSEAVDLVYDHVVGPLIEDAGDMAGKTLRHVLIDSWECGYQSWTDGLLGEFKRRRGYDPTPYLPSLASVPIVSKDISNRFLCDFRLTLDDLLAEEYYGHIRDRLHAEGLQLHAETLYGWQQMCGNPIRLYGVCDVPMNEIWMWREGLDTTRAYTGYAAASGHVYGKPVIKDEAFTVGGGLGNFSYVPADIKEKADFILCRGTNKFVMHTSVHQPDDRKPGWTHGWNGVNFHRGNTWWPYSGGLIKYLARCSHMMQQGLFVADICRYIGQEDTYSSGYGELPIDDLPDGYRADHCDNKALLERMDVKDGRIVFPDGMSYAALLLAEKSTMSPEVLAKLTEMVRKGATIIGPKPSSAPGLKDYPQCDTVVQEMANRLWGKCDGKAITESEFGKGRVIWGKSLSEVLINMDLQADFTCLSTSSDRINFAHRRSPDAEIYFVSTAGEACLADCWFRVSGKQPELFDPVTGEVSNIALYQEKDGRTRIPLRFEAQGSKIIVFRKESGDHMVELLHNCRLVWSSDRSLLEDLATLQADFTLDSRGSVVVNIPGETGDLAWTMESGEKGEIPATALPGPIKVSGSWTVSFEANRGAPAQINMDELISLSQDDDSGVKYFSGISTYSMDISLSDEYLQKNLGLILHLGEVKELAEVFINGKSAGVLWRPPFDIDITEHVRSGRNVLEIQVINTWVNRLIGDKNVPEDQWICRIVSPDPKWYNADSPLPASGLIGPVYIKTCLKATNPAFHTFDGTTKLSR